MEYKINKESFFGKDLSIYLSIYLTDLEDSGVSTSPIGDRETGTEKKHTKRYIFEQIWCGTGPLTIHQR